MKTFKFRKQLDSKQCGAACLSMACSQLGLDIAVSDIELLCGSTKEGVSMLSLKEAAKLLGIDSEVSFFSLEQIIQFDIPRILLSIVS